MAYPGGKGGAGVYQTIINLMPPHNVYIEPFLGAGAIMLNKRPATSSIGIDSDDDVLKLWKGDEVQNLTILHTDGIEFLSARRWNGDELVYCDPPYLMDTRSSKRAYYNHEMTDDDHRALLTVIKRIPAAIVISGYESQLYTDMLAGWRTTTFSAVTRSGSVATEWVWCNFPPPMQLHDYDHLGKTFRERERIKRKKQRWSSRLQRMPELERHALLSALRELEFRAPPAKLTIGAPTMRDHIAINDEPRGTSVSTMTPGVRNDVSDVTTGKADDGRAHR